MTRVLIMAGGTGGHIFPALAVARELTARGVSVTWLGTRGGMEVELVRQAGFPIDFISITGLRGKGFSGWMAAPLRLARALFQALRILCKRRPDAVLGMGGFASGPGGVAAWLSRRPLIIHEQNAVAGLTNRLLSPLARRVLAAFPGAFAPTRAQVIGNPIRAEISTMPEPAVRFASRAGALRLLVVGGSLGAAALNKAVPQALAEIPRDRRPLVLHQCGQRNLEQAREAYEKAAVAAEVVPFLEDMAMAYGEADLVICRAGALTVSELAAAGVGSVLVPFPLAVDDHQTLNAGYLADVGAAELVSQGELEPRLPELLRSLCADVTAGRKRLLAMAEAARKRASPESTEKVSAICLEVAQDSRHRPVEERA